MDRTSFAIKPTYYMTVEQALYNAGVDLSVEFTNTDASFPVPHITEVTVKEGRPEETARTVEAALKPFML